MYTTICTYYSFYDCCPGWVVNNPARTSHTKRIISTNCCIHTVVPPDDGPRNARNKLCIKFVFLYTVNPKCSGISMD